MTAAATLELHPLLQRMSAQTGCSVLDAASIDEWTDRAGHALLFFSEDPALHRETLDLAVIVPELARAFPGRFRIALLPPDAARAIAPRFGFLRWPALVLLKDGRHVGAIDGLRDWTTYHAELAHLLVAPATRPPSVGIPVRAG